jgi:hypothetical protein
MLKLIALAPLVYHDKRRDSSKTGQKALVLGLDQVQNHPAYEADVATQLEKY